MEQLLKWDKALFLFLNGLGTEFWDPVWLVISGTFVWLPFYALLIFILFKKLNLRLFLLSLLLITANVFLTDQGSVLLFKEQFQRLRPCHVEELIERMRVVKEGCGGRFGFVSSHAANTFGLAVLAGSILRPYYRYAMLWLLLWAAVVCYSRIYLGVHYPLDIMGGAIYGSLCGYLFYLIFKKIRR